MSFLYQEIWNWLEWARRTVIICGVLFILGFFAVQVAGAEIIFQVPTIEKTFKK